MATVKFQNYTIITKDSYSYLEFFPSFCLATLIVAVIILILLIALFVFLFWNSLKKTHPKIKHVNHPITSSPYCRVYPANIHPEIVIDRQEKQASAYDSRLETSMPIFGTSMLNNVGTNTFFPNIKGRRFSNLIAITCPTRY